MTIREVSNALNEIRGNMSNPEEMVVSVVDVANKEVVFSNGVAYSLETKDRIR